MTLRENIFVFALESEFLSHYRKSMHTQKIQGLVLEEGEDKRSNSCP